MKKLFLLISLIICGASYSQINIPNKVRPETSVSTRPDAPKPVYKSVIFDTTTKTIINKDSINNLINIIIEKDSLLQDVKDSNETKVKIIKNLKLDIPPKDSGFGAWVNYLIGLLSIFVVWCISFIPKLKNSNITLFQRLGNEASNFVKSIQYTCGTIAALIPLLMSSINFSVTVVSILGSIEIICLSITGFSLFLVKNTSDIKTNNK